MSVAASTEVEERHSREAIEAEIVRFEQRVRELQSGAITPEQFRPFRLKHGTYGQRQPGFQMLRVKIAAGGVRPPPPSIFAGFFHTQTPPAGPPCTRANNYIPIAELAK